jgi:hypothetical protein
MTGTSSKRGFARSFAGKIKAGQAQPLSPAADGIFLQMSDQPIQ